MKSSDQLLRTLLPAATLVLLLPATAWANQAPIVDDYSASPPTVLPGGVATLTVQAHDPDCASTCTSGCGEYINQSLTNWTASGGTILSEDNGSSGSPYTATADWQAPEAEGVYTVSVSVSDSGSFFCGGRQTTTVDLDIQVALTVNEPPVVTELTADPVLLFPGQTSALSCTAEDPDDDPVDYTWEADSGSVTPGAPGTAVFTAGDPGIVDVTCTATDPGGLFGSDFVGIAVTGAQADRVLDSTLVAPQRLSVSSTGDVYVVDEGGGGIRVINLFSGEPVYHLALPDARSVAVDWNDNLLVGMRSTAWLLDRRGSPLLTLGGGEDLGDISDVAVDAANFRYGVLHRSAGRVLVYDAAGAQIAAFGTTGDGPDQFKSPQGLAVTPSGDWVVTDPGHGLVKTFSVDPGAGTGSLESSFGELGPNAGEFVALDDVEVDGAGVIYVTDAFQDWVQSFNPDGTPREVLGSYGGGLGEFRTATGLAIIETYDRLLAASANGSAVQVFRTSDEAIPVVPAPVLDLAPASLSFGALPVLTQSAAQSVTLSNTGNAPLGVRGVAVHRNFAQSHDCGPFVDPGGSCSIQVSFTPPAVGSVSGTLVLDTSAEGGPAAVLLSGEGFAPPGVVFSPERLDYSDQRAGTTSVPKVVTLTNAGTVPLNIDSVETSAEYSEAGNCPVSLAGGASCSIQVFFEPATVADSIPGALSVTSNAPGSPHAIPLDGRGVPGSAIAIADVEQYEGDGEFVEAVFPVTLSRASDVPVSVDYTTEALTAAAAEDFEVTSGRLVFDPGESSRSIAVPILGDAILEPDEETFRVKLTHPVDAVIDDAQAVGTILDDEYCPGPNLLTNPGAEDWPAEGGIPGWSNAGSGFWVRHVTSREPVEGRASFQPSAGPGSATVSTPVTVGDAGGRELDFQAAGAASDPQQPDSEFGPAGLLQIVDVSAYATAIDEGSQRFGFEGWVRSDDESPPENARIVVEYRTAAGTQALDEFNSGPVATTEEWQRIHDERTAPPGTRKIRVFLVSKLQDGDTAGPLFDALSLRSLNAANIVVSDPEVSEGDTGFSEAVFSVALSCAYHRDLTLDYATADENAVPGVDYLPTAGTLSLSVGQTVATVPALVIGDTADEPHESFRLEVTLIDGEGAVRYDMQGEATIRNDDACPRSVADWAADPGVWPVNHLVIGGLDYGGPYLENLLQADGGGPGKQLARELAATLLNLELGSDPEILPLVEQADAFLVQHPPGSGMSGDARQTARDLEAQLAEYNTGGCP